MLLEEPHFRAAVAGRAQRPVLGQVGRHVVQFHVDHGHALVRRGQADRADLEHVVHPQLEELLGDLDLFGRADRLGPVLQLDDLLGLRRRLNALLAVGVVPLLPQRSVGEVPVQVLAEIVLGRAGEREPGRVLVPHLGLQVVGLAHLEVQGALADLHVDLDADLLEVLGDQRADVAVGTEHLDHREFDHDALAAREQAEALGVLLVQADRIEQPVGLGRVVLGVLEGVLVAGVVGMALLRNALARLAGAEEGGLVDLLAVDREGHGDAEVPVRQQLAQFRILGVGLVEDHARVKSAGARPQEDLVLAQLLLVLLEDRVVQQVDVALLLVQLAGDGGQVQRLRVGEELELDLVDVRQLVAGLVHADDSRDCA